jgi:hypothetical protein
VVDWASRAVTLEVPGWTLEFCGGDAPFLCISREGEHLGSMELLAWPTDDYASMREVLQNGGSGQEAMAAAVADLHATVEEDRKVGVGAGYELRGDPPVRLPVGGGEGLRSGFLGSVDGRPMERVVQYRAIQSDSVYLLSANASAGAGPREGDFPLEGFDELMPLLDRIAAASRFRGRGI